MQITPRIYQTVAIKAALKGLRGRFKRALVVMATGLGKTLTVAFITKKFRPKKTLFLVHNNFILKHALEEFRLVFDERTVMAMYNGMLKSGAKEADIVFATWQTMRRRLKKWSRNHFDLVIVDEAHHSEANTYHPVTEYFTGPKLGITATPDREDEADIRDIFGPEVVNVTLEEAIARGWLPRIEYHVITDESLNDKKLQEIAAEIREGKKRFTVAEVNRRIFIRKRDREITRIINDYNEKAIVFCASIAHAERLKKTLKLSGTFHSRKANDQWNTWKKNLEVLKALHNGIIRRVCAVNAFNEGVDVPSVRLVAFCRVTEALTVFRQQLGRGLRPGKDKLIVLDFVGNLERIQLVLETMNRISDLHEKYTDREEIEREGYERKKFEVSGKGFEFTFSDNVVDLMEVLNHCELEFYPTWQEASQATQQLGFKKYLDYKKWHHRDLRLPSNPNVTYPDFPGYPEFLGQERYHRRIFYPTWQEASRAAIALNIKGIREYEVRFREDPRLPSRPYYVYSDFPGFIEFLGREQKIFYPTWQEASYATRKKDIFSRREYNEQYKSDSRLPSRPHKVYPDFPGWGIFLGTGKTMRVGDNVYSTLAEASSAAKKLGITKEPEYKLRYKEDPKLPSSPERKYKDFPGWGTFLGTGTVSRKGAPIYGSWQEASKATIDLGIKNSDYYRKGGYKEDPKLPSSPHVVYSDFPGWKKFLGKE